MTVAILETASARAELIIPRSCTEAGNAERLADRYAGQFRFCAALGGWLRWNGCKWEPGETGLKMAALYTVRGIGAEAACCPNEVQRAALLKHALKSETNGALTGMIGIARDLPEFVTEADAFDADPWALNVQNGTIDLRTGERHDHDAAALHTQVANVRFDAAATCPTFARFLAEVLPDPEVRAFVQRLAGYCLTGLTNERKFVFFFGEGRNGKSILLNVLYRLLGDYAVVPVRDLFASQDRERHGTFMADLKGKRLAAMSENTKGKRLDEALVKNATGDEPITANRMRCDPMTFCMTAKLVFAANDRLRVDADSQAVFDRLLEVPFGVRIPDDKVDRDLGAKLEAEASGILNWCLAGLAEWRTRGLGTAKAIEAAIIEYRAESDDVAKFVALGWEKSTTDRVNRADVYRGYTDWCSETKCPIEPQSSFYKRLRTMGVNELKSNGVNYLGLREGGKGRDAFSP